MSHLLNPTACLHPTAAFALPSRRSLSAPAIYRCRCAIIHPLPCTPLPLAHLHAPCSSPPSTPAQSLPTIAAALSACLAALQRDAEKNFEEFTEGLGGATVELLRADMQAPFVSRAHPELLLAFLKEATEGHFEPMQDLLVGQPNSAVDVDVTCEVCKLLLAVEGSLDASNLGQARLACEMLIEVLQGNTSGRNSNSLLETKLVEMCNRILTKPRKAADPDTPPMHPDAFAHLEFLVLTLLHALLETNEGPALLRMNEALDLPGVALLASKCYEEARNEPRKRGGGGEDIAPDERVGAGFLAYTLLRKITDQHTGASEILRIYDGMTEASKKHYTTYLGHVEIANAAGMLERIYFRIPTASPQTRSQAALHRSRLAEHVASSPEFNSAFGYSGWSHQSPRAFDSRHFLSTCCYCRPRPKSTCSGASIERRLEWLSKNFYSRLLTCTSRLYGKTSFPAFASSSASCWRQAHAHPDTSYPKLRILTSPLNTPRLVPATHRGF